MLVWFKKRTVMVRWGKSLSNKFRKKCKRALRWCISSNFGAIYVDILIQRL